MLRVLGAISILMGILLLVYIIYALLFLQNDTKSGNPFSALLLCAMMLMCGFKWIKGERMS